MTITIPVWVLWALGIAGTALALVAVAVVIALAIIGKGFLDGFAGGLKW
jgi:hypothetical protein